VIPNWDDIDRRYQPLTEQPVEGEPRKATELVIDICGIQHARTLIERWHSRLPKTQKGPWQRAFRAHWNGYTYAVALWHNPSARTLPGHWAELRRMAVAPDAPPHTASRMLGQMARWYRLNAPESERLISYQDCDVHTGTIYLAAGWDPAYKSKPRVRQRAGYARPGSQREYRTSINGAPADVAAKVRWELVL
jgi:hypothetical protein